MHNIELLTPNSLNVAELVGLWNHNRENGSEKEILNDYFSDQMSKSNAMCIPDLPCGTNWDCVPNFPCPMKDKCFCPGGQ